MSAQVFSTDRIVRGTVAALTALLAICAVIVTRAAFTHDDSPGPDWVHDRGSIYWTCTSDGHALIKDTDTGSTMLARDDRKCDSGG